jgi:cell division protein FtsW
LPVILTKKYIKNRFLAFLDPSTDPLNIGYQIKQALIAVGKGGWFGAGFGKSVQKFGYLPEVQSDTIFAAIAEEFGFIRTLCFLAIFLYIAYRGFRIAKKAPDDFSRLVAVGITVWLVGQSLINIAVNLSLLPLTGLTLPFVSYGGTSLITAFIALGILLNISRYADTATARVSHSPTVDYRKNRPRRMRRY